MKPILLGSKSFKKTRSLIPRYFQTAQLLLHAPIKHEPPAQTCYHFTKLIWEWTEMKDIHITAAHIPGEKNIEADRESRELSVDLKTLKTLKPLVLIHGHLTGAPSDSMPFYRFQSFQMSLKMKAENADGILVVPFWSIKHGFLLYSKC